MNSIFVIKLDDKHWLGKEIPWYPTCDGIAFPIKTTSILDRFDPPKINKVELIQYAEFFYTNSPNITNLKLFYPEAVVEEYKLVKI